MIYQERGSVYLRDNQFQRAVNDESEAVKIDPAMAYAYFLRGVAYAKIGDDEKGVADTQKAIQLDPKLSQLIKLNGQSLTR